MADSKEYELRFKGKNELGPAATDAAADIQKLADALEDPAQRADAVATEIEAMFTAIGQDAERTQQVVEKFTAALGPDLAASLGKSGSSVEAMVGKFREAGLTLDEIEANTGRLTQTIEQAASVANKHGDAVAADFDRMGAGAERARGVMSNMVGNALQELPGISGALGPINVALGQMAEAAMEGGGAIGAMGPAIAGVAAVGAGLAAIPQIIDDLTGAEERAFNADMAKSMAAAVDELGVNYDDATKSAQALADVWNKQGLEGFGMAGLDVTFDLKAVLDAAGVSMQFFADAVTGGQPGLDELRSTMQAAGVEGLLFNSIMDNAARQQDAYRAAVERAQVIEEARLKIQNARAASEQSAADSTEAHARALDEYTSSRLLANQAEEEAAKRSADAETHRRSEAQASIDFAREEAAAQEELARVYGEGTRARVAGAAAEIAAQQELEQARRDAEQAAEELFSAERARYDVQGRLTRAMNESAGAVDAYGQAANDSKTPALQLVALSQGVSDAAMSQADAVLAAAENTAKLSGQTLDAGQKQAVFQQALLDFANNLPELSPLRKQILDLANGFDDIPTDVTTNVSAPGADQAAQDLTDVRMEQDRVKPTTTTTAEVQGQVLTIQLLAAIRKIQDDINSTRVVVTPTVNIGGALAQVNALKGALAGIASSASSASSAAINSAQNAQKAINQMRAGAVLTNGRTT